MSAVNGPTLGGGRVGALADGAQMSGEVRVLPNRARVVVFGCFRAVADSGCVGV